MGDILIVDDERDIRELISDILKDEGFTTRLAGTSDECMAEMNKEPPALMILDIWLKDSSMDGIDILKHRSVDGGGDARHGNLALAPREFGSPPQGRDNCRNDRLLAAVPCFEVTA